MSFFSLFSNRSSRRLLLPMSCWLVTCMGCSPGMREVVVEINPIPELLADGKPWDADGTPPDPEVRLTGEPELASLDGQGLYRASFGEMSEDELKKSFTILITDNERDNPMETPAKICEQDVELTDEDLENERKKFDRCDKTDAAGDVTFTLVFEKVK